MSRAERTDIQGDSDVSTRSLMFQTSLCQTPSNRLNQTPANPKMCEQEKLMFSSHWIGEEVCFTALLWIQLIDGHCRKEDM